eukprot:TRINITY_DN12992_c0_g1_i1.p1 TRINITY_DN12992_c0_g1~~TRINITY_DN12992_c0_g1_i1.p1  ORF type:complete len:1162 (+),score=215.54 TRINITY_DN12992_c0_g1_i1:250-3486(+)
MDLDQFSDFGFFDVWPANNAQRVKGVLDHVPAKKPPFLPTSRRGGSSRSVPSTVNQQPAKPKMLIELENYIKEQLTLLPTLEAEEAPDFVSKDETIARRTDEEDPNGIGPESIEAFVQEAEAEAEAEAQPEDKKTTFSKIAASLPTEEEVPDDYISLMDNIYSSSIQRLRSEVRNDSELGDYPDAGAQKPVQPQDWQEVRPASHQEKVQLRHAAKHSSGTVKRKLQPLPHIPEPLGETADGFTGFSTQVMKTIATQRRRLNVFREAAKMFGIAFKSYQPLLQSILSEFDSLAQLQDSLIGRALSVIDQLHVSHDLERQKHGAREATWKRTIKDLKKQIAAQNRTIKATEAELNETREKLHEVQESIGFTVEEERESKQNNAVLVRTIRKLELDKELLLQEQHTRDREVGAVVEKWESEKEKVQELNYLMEGLHAKLTAAQQTIESLQTINLGLTKQYDEDLGSVSKLKAEVAAGKARIAQLTQQLHQLSDKLLVANAELANFKSLDLTPRPNWSAYAELAAGSDTKTAVTRLVVKLQMVESQVAGFEAEAMAYREFKGMVRSRDKLSVDVLEAQPKYFTPLGNASDVPKFLRFPKEQRVRNRRLTQRDALGVMAEFWVARQKQRERPNKSDYLNTIASDYLYEWLKLKYGVKSVVMEWSYSLMHVLTNLTKVSAAQMMVKVIELDLPEALWHDIAGILSGLKQAFVSWDVEMATRSDPLPARSKELPRSEYIACLQSHFGFKDDERFARLLLSLQSYTSSGNYETLHYEKLFDHDDDHNESEFVKEIRLQYMEERDEWFYDMESFAIRRKHEQDLQVAARSAPQSPAPQSGTASPTARVASPTQASTSVLLEQLPSVIDELQPNVELIQEEEEEAPQETEEQRRAKIRSTTATPAFFAELLQEYDTGMPLEDRVALLCRAFHCHAPYLFGEDPSTNTERPFSQSRRKPGEAEEESEEVPERGAHSPPEEFFSDDPDGTEEAKTDTKASREAEKKAKARKVESRGKDLLFGDKRRDKGENPRRSSLTASLRDRPFTDAPETAISLGLILGRLRRGLIQRYSKKLYDPNTKKKKIQITMI